MKQQFIATSILALMAMMLLSATVNAARFVDNGDYTITDTLTGLIWEQKTDNGGPRDMNSTYTWAEALEYCKDLNLAGRTDWRLPNLKELSSIADLSRYSPAIYTIFEYYSVKDRYWSSTTEADYESRAMLIHFHDGGLSNGSKLEEEYYVRAVRGGQEGTSDLNRDGEVNLLDAVLALQALTGLDPSVEIFSDESVTDSRKIHMMDAVFILREEAGF